MSTNDDTPRSVQQQRDYDHILIRTIKGEFGDVRREVRAYRDEAVQSNARLDEHIKSCDRRYSQMHTSMGAQPQPGSKDWLVKHVGSRLLDYGVYAMILLVIFAWKHGFSMPVPSSP